MEGCWNNNSVNEKKKSLWHSFFFWLEGLSLPKTHCASKISKTICDSAFSCLYFFNIKLVLFYLPGVSWNIKPLVEVSVIELFHGVGWLAPHPISVPWGKLLFFLLVFSFPETITWPQVNRFHLPGFEITVYPFLRLVVKSRPGGPVCPTI